MYLKALTISGFKSFAKKGDLEFSAPITAIVGPNGSGKSNIAESFRFVLGEQSVKSMRGKRGEDLIWGGSESVARGNRASVSVVLDNAKRQFPLDFDEVRIERIVHRDGQNEYLLNGSTVRLKDVQELLAVANIGPTGHHIISQGEADRILSAGARERREMIEDALGLKVYQLRKQEAERKLKKTEENIKEVEVLRREAAPHLNYLSKQIQKIQKSLELQAKLKEVYVEYLKREDTYLAFHTDRLQLERREPSAQLEQVKEELDAAKRVLREAETVDVRSQGVVEAEERWRAASKERQALLLELGKVDGQLTYVIRRLEEQARRQAQGVRVTAIARPELERVIADIEQKVSGVIARDDLALLRRALTDVVHRLRTLLERAPEVAETGDEARQLEKERNELTAEQKKLQERMGEAEAGESTARTAYEAVRASLEAEAQGARAAEREVFRLVGEQRALESTIERIDRELAVLDRDRQEFKREMTEAVALLGREVARYFEYEVRAEGAVLTAEVMAAESREVQRTRRHDLEKLKIRLEELGIGATDEVMKEYQAAKERDEFLEREITDLTASVEKLRVLIVELTAQLHEQFFAGIEKISVEFNRFFVLMFGGGEAALERVDVKTRSRDVVEGEEGGEDDDGGETEVGIELAVKLPNKRVKGLEMLSGGERALTSIALIFAMSQVNPPPFVILDETDAALDEANSRRYGDLIEALAQKSQLILITHNRETMSRASILYGITMGSDGVSKLLSVRLEDALAVAK